MTVRLRTVSALRDAAIKPRLSIAVSGSAGTGKTTLGRRLAEVLELPFVPEGMRRRLESGLDLHALDRAAFRALLEDLYLESAAAKDHAVTEHGGFVAEHSALDYGAFWLYYGFAADQAASDRYLQRARRDLARYDAVVVLPWNGIDLVDDGVRSVNRWRQLHLQALIEGLSARFLPADRMHLLPAEVTDPEDRLRWVLMAVDSSG